MHIGPFGNIAHGNGSIVADLAGRKMGEYLITEAGFGSDLGMEKFMDIVCRAGGFAPNAIVIVATAKALNARPRGRPAQLRGRQPARHRGGSETWAPHRERQGVRRAVVVAANRFPGDTDDEVALVQKLALEHGAHAAVLNEGFSQGGAGAADMARRSPTRPTSRDRSASSTDSDPIGVKIEKIATRVPGRRRRLPAAARRRSSSSPATA
jgi:formyltetrahydrofolate synthetase